jgi:hypothetical protein
MMLLAHAFLHDGRNQTLAFSFCIYSIASLVSPSILLTDVLLNPLPLSPLADNLTRASSEATKHDDHEKRQTAIEHLPASFALPPQHARPEPF